MYCENCGYNVKDGVKFCPNCGQPVHQGNAGYNDPFGSSQNVYTCARIQKRDIAIAVVLSVVTCGIYSVYWLYCLVNDLNEASDEPTDTSGGSVILLTLITCGIYGIYWYYKAGGKVAKMQRNHGYPSNDNPGVLYLILAIFGFAIVNMCLIQSELNKVAPK